MRSAMYEEERWARGVMVFVYPCRAGMRTFYAWDHVNKVELADSYPFMESHTNLSYSNVINCENYKGYFSGGGGWSLLSLLCKWQDLSSFLFFFFDSFDMTVSCFSKKNVITTHHCRPELWRVQFILFFCFCLKIWHYCKWRRYHPPGFQSGG